MRRIHARSMRRIGDGDDALPNGTALADLRRARRAKRSPESIVHQTKGKRVDNGRKAEYRKLVRVRTRGVAIVGELEPSESEIERVALALRGIVQASHWERTLAVGKLIYDSFFGQNENSWRERRRNKNQSIRRLAERPECPFAKSSLTEAIGIYVLCSKYPEARCAGRLSPTHVAKVLGLQPEIAIGLLRTAEQEEWSVREVAAEARRMRKEMGERRGRPLSDLAARATKWGRRALVAVEQMRAELSTASIDASSRDSLCSLCDAIQEELFTAKALLRPNAFPSRPVSIAKIQVPASSSRAAG